MTAADELAGDARQLAAFPDEVVSVAVRGFASAVRPVLRADTGGDNVLSGAGGRLNVTTQQDRQLFVATGLVAAGPRRLRGQWRWLQDGVRPHGPGDHPGTPARQTFTDPIDAAASGVVAEIESRFRTVIS